MMFLSLKSDLIIAGIVFAIAIILIILSLHFYNKNVNVRKYKKKLKTLNKLRDKKYNANVFIDLLYNNYITDQTNTYERLKKKGQKKVKKYFSFYLKELDQLVHMKSNISPNKNLNKLIIIFKREDNQVLGKFFIQQKFKKLRKQIDKHQLLFDMIAYVYELPEFIDQDKTYYLENHDNHHVISYKISETFKK
jgi:hypothetical protein